MRQWPAETTALRVQTIHRVLAAIPPSLPVARPLPTRQGDTLLAVDGRLWELNEWLPGAPRRTRPIAEPAIRAALAMLAEIHAALLPLDPVPPGLPPSWQERRTRLVNWDEGRHVTPAVQRQVEPSLAGRVRRTLAALERWGPGIRAELAQPVSTHMQWVLRDVWRENLLFEGDRLTGLVDFGAMRIDTPATDIARLLGSLTKEPDAWQRGLAAYEHVRPLTRQDRSLVSWYYRSGLLLSALSWLDWLVLERRDFADREAALARWDELLADLERNPILESFSR